MIVQQHDSSMAKEFNIPADVFHTKSKELRNAYQAKIKIEQVILSDECLDIDEELTKETTELFNSRVLGFSKDYIEETEDMPPNKEKPGNS